MIMDNKEDTDFTYYQELIYRHLGCVFSFAEGYILSKTIIIKY